MNHCRYCQRPFSGPQEDDEVCDRCVSEEMHRQNDPRQIGDDDLFDDQGDGFGPWPDDCDEPTGSCDWCGTNVYGGGDLCDQCEWQAEQAPVPRRRADGTFEGGWEVLT